MFTGIIRSKPQVTSIQKKNEVMQLSIAACPYLLESLQTGASIAIDGTCLSVTHFDQNNISFDVIPQTLQCTTLGALAVNDHVHAERAAKFGDEIGGHLLSGHVYGTAEVISHEHQSESSVLRLRVPKEWMKYLLLRGYVAVDGASLTIATVETDGFSVHLIPETLRLTKLGSKAKGDKVNIEIDTQTQAIVDSVEKIIQRN